MGKPIESTHTEMEQILPLIKKTLTDNKTVTENRSIIRNDVTYHEAITVFPIQSGKEPGAVIRIDDITKEIELQNRLTQSQKMRVSKL